MGIGKEKQGLHNFTSKTIQEPKSNNRFSLSRHLFQYSSSHSCTDNVPYRSVDVNIWHKKLGHMSISRMQSPHFLSKNDSLSHCSICPISKQGRLASQFKSSSIFQLVHMDLWRSFHTPAYNGEMYFLTIVDDFSQGTWVYLIESKIYVFRMIRLFFAMAENQFSKKTQAIWIDNATEFFKSECQLFYFCLESNTP